MSEWIKNTGVQPVSSNTDVDILTEDDILYEVYPAHYWSWDKSHVAFWRYSYSEDDPKTQPPIVKHPLSLDDAYDHLNSPNIFTTNTAGNFVYPKTNYITKTDEELKESEEKRKEALVESKEAKVEKLFEEITGRKISYDDYMLVKTLEALITIHSK